MTPTERVDVAVIGGGMAGLVAARTAARAGERVALFEAADRVGGLVGSHRVGGLELDSGAESFATRGDTVPQLARELGLPVVTPDPAPARVLHDGRLIPLPATGVLGIPTDLDASGLADSLGEAGLARAREDAHLPVSDPGTTAQLTLAELVTWRMGEAVLEALVRPIVRGVHSTEPEKLAAERLLPDIGSRLTRTGSLAAALAEQRANAPAGSAVAGLDGGVHQLPAALAADITAHGGQLHTGALVHHLRPATSTATSTGAGTHTGFGAGTGTVGTDTGIGTDWTVRAGTRDVVARRVVLACPPHTWTFLPGHADDEGASNEGATIQAARENPQVAAGHTQRGEGHTQAAPGYRGPATGRPPGASKPPATADDRPLTALAAAAEGWPAPQTIDLLTLVLRADLLPAHHRAGTLVAEPGNGAKALTYTSSKWEWVARAAAQIPGPELVVLRLSYQAGVLPEALTITGTGRKALDEDGQRASTEHGHALAGYDRRALAEHGLRDAARLTGTAGPWPAEALIDLAHTRHHPPAPASAIGQARQDMTAALERVRGITLTGAWWAGTGLAAVVAHASSNLAQDSEPST